MYGYQEEWEGITPEQLIQKITQEQIFEFIFKKSIDFTEKQTSPFRKDNSPGCFFNYKDDGKLMFIDYGEPKGKTHRTCFNCVMEKYNVTLNMAVQVICKQFHLSNSQIEYQPIPEVVYTKVEKAPTLIGYRARQFQKKDILYWSKFLIKVEHLVEDNIFPVSHIKIHKGEKMTNMELFGLCYAFDFIDAVKLYQPYSSKYKWITNCDEDDIGNIDNLPATGEHLIISKSYKDHRVLRNMNPNLNVVWVQNEGCVPSIDILENLAQRFKLITIFFDNDKAGLKMSKKLVEIFKTTGKLGVRRKYLPKRYGYKDPSDFVSKEGREDLVKVLKKIGVYGKDT